MNYHIRRFVLSSLCVGAFVAAGIWWCSFYYVLNMFRTLIYPSSGACDCVGELPHPSSCSQFVVCWSFCRGWYLVVFVLQAETDKILSAVILLAFFFHLCTYRFSLLVTEREGHSGVLAGHIATAT